MRIVRRSDQRRYRAGAHCKDYHLICKVIITPEEYIFCVKPIYTLHDWPPKCRVQQIRYVTMHMGLSGYEITAGWTDSIVLI